MGKKKEKEQVTNLAAGQARTADTQENVANQFLGYSAEDRARQKELGTKLDPFASGLLSGDYFSGNARPARPDMTQVYGRNLADEQAGIQADENQAIARAAEYAAGSGAARTGATGLGLGAAFRGSDAARSTARRTYQTDVTGERLAQHEDEVARQEDELNRRKMGLDAAFGGADIVQGQQQLVDPTRTAAVGTTNLAQSVASRGAAQSGYETAAKMPGRWSWLTGLAGAGLNLAANAVAPGSGGLASIWRGRKTAAAPAYA